MVGGASGNLPAVGGGAGYEAIAKPDYIVRARHVLDHGCYPEDLTTDDAQHDLPPAAPKRAYKTPENLEALYGRQHGECPGCHGHYRAKDMHIDHIQPQAHGGTHDLSNLQLLCGHCNTTKGTGTMADLRRRLAKQRAKQRARVNNDARLAYPY